MIAELLPVYPLQMFLTETELPPALYFTNWFLAQIVTRSTNVPGHPVGWMMRLGEKKAYARALPDPASPTPDRMLFKFSGLVLVTFYTYEDNQVERDYTYRLIKQDPVVRLDSGLLITKAVWPD